ncbi:uncharacterized protein B0H18DRAFT_23624 [Fomitopsis serialis]|uniref:uncharacterized protein n=1 Tax=Fomitopsis serialis TaxID=139415 RepID=UPI00200734EB|nr:uncharacterized protein B0H18DRAFT_23624 [Neoantrodia serialis]KAH9938702.1 hypothetical protein B0H18DRAFT_23624 [Neoantrodia serialis]
MLSDWQVWFDCKGSCAHVPRREQTCWRSSPASLLCLWVQGFPAFGFNIVTKSAVIGLVEALDGEPDPEWSIKPRSGK